MSQETDIAALRKAAQEGWMIVPVRPTSEMLSAMAECDGYLPGDRDRPGLTRWEDYWRMAMSAAPKQAVVLALLDRLERAEQDTELLDWLADPDNHDGDVRLPAKCVEQNPHSMRDAIRAAMQGEGA